MTRFLIALILAASPAAAEPWFQPAATLTGMAEAHDGDDLKFAALCSKRTSRKVVLALRGLSGD